MWSRRSSRAAGSLEYAGAGLSGTDRGHGGGEAAWPACVGAGRKETAMWSWKRSSKTGAR